MRRSEREDLSQEISAQLWRAFPGYDRNRRFSTWAYRIALNVAISFGRKARRRTDRFTSNDAVFEALPAHEHVDGEAELLRALIARFSPLDRALVLLYLEGYDYGESAEILGISATNVATKLSRLKERLRRDVADERAKENV